MPLNPKSTDEIFHEVQIFTGIAAVFIPFLIWYLNKSDKRDDIYNTERYSKRLDLLKKLSELVDEHKLDDLSGQNKHLLSEEITAAFHFFTTQAAQHAREKDSEFHLLAGHSNNGPAETRADFWKRISLKRIFLLYKPSTLAVFILQVLFWMMCFIIVAIGATVIYTTDTLGSAKLDFLVTGVIILIIFLLLAKVLNWNANKFQDRKKLAAFTKSNQF